MQIEWEETETRAELEQRGMDFMHSGVVEAIRKNKVALKGPLADSRCRGGSAKHRTLGPREALDLYANLRPVKNLEGVKTRFDGVDLVLIRENTEDLYAGLEHEVVPGVVESLKIITEKASTRIARFAFEYARKHERKKIHAIHKANIMKLSDGLFISCIRNLRGGGRIPFEIEYKELISRQCLHADGSSIRRQYDMLLLFAKTLYGDIMSDLAAGLVGGLGMVPSGNIGEGVAIFEAVHGTAPDITGKGIANPTALLMSAIMMLDHIGEANAARDIERALHKVYREGKSLTRDVGGAASTSEFTNAVISLLG